MVGAMVRAAVSMLHPLNQGCVLRWHPGLKQGKGKVLKYKIQGKELGNGGMTLRKPLHCPVPLNKPNTQSSGEAAMASQGCVLQQKLPALSSLPPFSASGATLSFQ